MFRYTLLRSLALVLAIVATAAFAGDAADKAPATSELHALVDAQMMRNINREPELRSMLGITGGPAGDTTGQLNDVSLPRREALRAEMQANLDVIQSWDRDRLHGQDQWTQAMVAWFYRTQIDLMAFDWAPAWLPAGASVYAVDQLFSVPVQLPQFMDNQHQVTDAASARRYIERLRAIATKLDQVGDNFDMQARHGVIPPEVALQGAADQIRGLIAPEPAASPFVASLRAKLEKADGIAESQRAELLAQAATAVRDATNPGYARLLARLERALAKKPGNHGMWALPQGAAYYDAALRWNTSTTLDAEQIHQLGLDEVARIEAEMDRLLQAQGLPEGSVREGIERLAKDPRYAYPDSDAGRQALMADIDRILADMRQRVPRYFEHVPPQPLEVRRIPVLAEAASPGGYYSQPAMDGSRSGVFFINLRDMASYTRWNLPTLIYHEGIPGHHFQIARGQTLTELPLLRRSLNPSAYSEGWALYAEQLASEMGVYRDQPLGELGRLQAEMFRSVRLVVDTGLHRKRWTPERAIAYMRDKTGMTEADARSEVYRYLVQPGQACSYKIGHLKMVELRDRAQRKLGERFDLRAFHDVVLGNGSLPLLVLEQVVDAWIASVAAGADAAPAGTTD
jgi:uncharacterized protein (DUF885 family)